MWIYGKKTERREDFKNVIFYLLSDDLFIMMAVPLALSVTEKHVNAYTSKSGNRGNNY